MKLWPLLVLLLCFSVASVSAGGSVSFVEMKALLPGAIKTHLDEVFEIPEVGEATRLGRQYSNLGGTRIGPYIFAVNSKKSGAELELVIHTDVFFLDAAGSDQVKPEKAASVSEKFYAYEVRLPGVVNTSAMPLSEAERAEAIDEAKATYTEVEGLALQTQRGEVPSEDERWGNFARGKDGAGNLRKATVSLGEGDHGGSTLTGYFDATGALRFLLWEDSVWYFDPDKQGQTINEVTERRFYFSQDGRLAQMLIKSYWGKSEAELKKAREAAKNVSMQTGLVREPAPELSRIGTAPVKELFGLLDVLMELREAFTAD